MSSPEASGSSDNKDSKNVNIEGTTADSSTPTTETTCKGCNKIFKSRNAIFKHLNETDGSCLTGQDYIEFCKYVRPKFNKLKKCLLLYGYIPCPPYIKNGDDAAQILMKAVNECQNQMDSNTHVGFNSEKNNNGDIIVTDRSTTTSSSTTPTTEDSVSSTFKINRSYGYNSRGHDACKQDDGTGAITEVLATKLHPLRGGRTVDQWIDHVQEILDKQFLSLRQSSKDFVVPIRILAREQISNMKFNAETNVTHRRVEYVMPIDFLTFGCNNNPELKHELENLPAFTENTKCHKNDPDFEFVFRSTHSTKSREFLQGLKKVMHSLATQIIHVDMNDKGTVMEKNFNIQKRRGQQRKRNKQKQNNNKKTQQSMDNQSSSSNSNKINSIDKELDNEEKKKDGTDMGPTNPTTKNQSRPRILKRKRFHNFSPKLTAHEYVAYRRLDRVWHRSTLRFPTLDQPSKTFITLSMTGDMFLTGQICRVVGLFLAIANGYIDPDIVDCVFDEEYPHLVPTPPAPMLGVLADEATYMTWEGKLKMTLNPRICHIYDKGFNNIRTLERVKEWQNEVHKTLASRWLSYGTDESSGRLLAEKEWTENVLVPWAERAREQLDDYRKWVNSRQPSSLMTPSINGDATSSSLVPPHIESIDPAIPKAYQDVLYHLRKVDSSGQWPSTTLKRQLVMISSSTTATTSGEVATIDDGSSEKNTGLSSCIEKKSTTSTATSLSEAYNKAKDNKVKRSCAYSFVEGQGGASGSFSVGYMPGVINKQPKSNFLFPDLVKSAFELERRLFPHREPSSTIAINRNAQFRPHTDSGAGAGQSTSLIVGLGTYSGGELMVEGNKHDIRYKAIEFNGWKQRHWTMPFNGERYSLVWFTPKGCEGMRGVDLDFPSSAQSVAADPVAREEATTTAGDGQAGSP